MDWQHAIQLSTFVTHSYEQFDVNEECRLPSAP